MLEIDITDVEKIIEELQHEEKQNEIIRMKKT